MDQVDTKRPRVDRLDRKEGRSWVGSSMNELAEVSRVPLYGIKSSTLKVQLITKSGGRSTT